MQPGLNIFSDISSSGLGALGFNWGSFLIQVASFILVFLILKRFAFKPILRVLADRRKLIEDGVKLGEEMKKKTAELEEEIAEKLRKARATADEIIGTAQVEARDLVKSAEEGARAKVEQISAEAQDRIKRDTLAAKKQLEKELVGLISEATEAIIEVKIDAKKDAELIDKALHGRQTA